jgi:hypothetical protein
MTVFAFHSGHDVYCACKNVLQHFQIAIGIGKTGPHWSLATNIPRKLRNFIGVGTVTRYR